jgi:beta-glucosidase
MRANDFSARYATNFKASANGAITFEIGADDGFRFFINGKTILTPGPESPGTFLPTH